MPELGQYLNEYLGHLPQTDEIPWVRFRLKTLPYLSGITSIIGASENEFDHLGHYHKKSCAIYRNNKTYQKQVALMKQSEIGV